MSDLDSLGAFDVIILGTGLVESILSAFVPFYDLYDVCNFCVFYMSSYSALSRIGYKVLVLEKVCT